MDAASFLNQMNIIARAYHSLIRRFRAMLQTARATCFWIDLMLKSRHPSGRLEVILPPINLHRHYLMLASFLDEVKLEASIKVDVRAIRNMLADKYSSRLLAVPSKLTAKSIPNAANKIQLFTHYFDPGSDDFHVPLRPHPSFVPPASLSSKRVQKCLFIGNVSAAYNDLKNTPAFSDFLSRSEWWSLLCSDSRVQVAQSRDHLFETLLSSEYDIVIASTTDFKLSPEDYCEALNTVTHFLALPGVTYPLTHSMAESAMMGCQVLIPFLSSLSISPQQFGIERHRCNDVRSVDEIVQNLQGTNGDIVNGLMAIEAQKVLSAGRLLILSSESAVHGLRQGLHTSPTQQPPT